MADLSKKPFLQQLRNLLADGIRRIDNDECDEAQAVGMVAQLNVESDKYYGKRRFVTYDRAMRITGILQRTKFKQFCDEHGILQQTVSGQKVGFLRSEIDDLAEEIREENRKRGC